ncbi:MAG: hypothetical protein JO033_25940 [Acidobacteriaceae bacterium]|nr:hypothetical protein [Acidobacteriaceae bacterium]
MRVQVSIRTQELREISFSVLRRGSHRPKRYARSRMAHYIVRAKPKPERLPELHTRLCENAFVNLRPFGKALTYSLSEARTQPDGTAIWEEEDYCSPPLAQERAAVLDKYFDEITVEQVNAGEGWKQIEALPKLNANG